MYVTYEKPYVLSWPKIFEFFLWKNLWKLLMNSFLTEKYIFLANPIYFKNTYTSY